MDKEKIYVEEILQRHLKVSPFNSIGGDLKFTACVGTNGGYNQTTIYYGFVDAVKTLIKSIGEYENSADPMVYPILFCLRHSIELFLKTLYSDLVYIKCLRDNPSDFNESLKLQKNCFKLKCLQEECDIKLDREHLNGIGGTEIQNLVQQKEALQNQLDNMEQTIKTLNAKIFEKMVTNEYTHDLNGLICKILSLYKIDERIKESFDIVLPILEYYRYIDPNGDAFRYWYDKEGEAHFETKEIGIIRLDIIATQFEQITECFENIEFNIFCILKECKTGTFTKELSRFQIEEISKMLPKQEEFNEKIKQIKEEIKHKYRIGSNKFDNILDLIRNHREFSANMGAEKPFLDLSDNAISLFAKCSLGLEEWEHSTHNITTDELNLFITFSEIGRSEFWGQGNSYFSEDLDWLFEYNKNARNLCCFDVVPKTGIKYVIRGMEKCGQVTYAQKLKQYLTDYELKSLNSKN